MKKIITAVAAIAMAATMFAADASAQLKLKTSLFNSAKEVLTSPASTGFDVNETHVKFAVSADKAGASMILKDADVRLGDMTVWFQPTDAVKITLGNVDTGSINRGTFAWWHRTVRVTTETAITVNANVGDVAIEFVTFNGPLFNFSNSGYGMVGNFLLTANIGLGDAGTLQIIAEKGADLSAYGVGGWEGSGLTGFGVAYDHMPWQQTGFYADAVCALDGNFGFYKVASQIGGQYAADGLALRLSNMLAFGQKYGNGSNAFTYGFVAKAEYAMDGFTPYLQVKGPEIMDKKFDFNAGVTTSVGSCNIDASFEGAYDGSAFTFSVPVVCGVSF